MCAFERIIGYSTEKKELERIADILRNPADYEKLGVNVPKGLLLFGEPGVGKTLMANVLIEESGRPAFTCRKERSGGEFLAAIRETFETAAKNAPAIVFLDDMDKFANGDSRRRDAEEYVTVQSCIDGICGKDVFVLATANSPEHLPHSLLRAGRFDRIIEVEAPQGKDAEKIIAHYIGNRKYAESLDIGTVARILDGHSCAELETVLNEAGLYAGFEKKSEITMEHFLKACMKTVFSVSAKALQSDDGEDEDGESGAGRCCSQREGAVLPQIVCHEVGHALVAEVLCPESVVLLSAYSRKGQHGGFSRICPNGEMDPVRWQQISMLSALGGKAATEQRLGICDGGSAKDLDQAFEIARGLVIDCCSRGFDLYSRGYEDSDALNERQEVAASAEIDRCFRRAKEIITANRTFFDALSEALMQKGILTVADIQKIKNGCRIVPVTV